MFTLKYGGNNSLPHLKQYKETIREVLTDREDCRDNDRRLYFNVCLRLGVDLREITGWKMLECVADETLPSYDSVTRLRRMVQVDSPELRGKFDNDRHIDRVIEAQHQLGYKTLDQRTQGELSLD